MYASVIPRILQVFPAQWPFIYVTIKDAQRKLNRTYYQANKCPQKLTHFPRLVQVANLLVLINPRIPYIEEGCVWG